MNVSKTLTALGAALCMIAISGPVSAFDCVDGDGKVDQKITTDNLIALAAALRCKDETDTTVASGWPNENNDAMGAAWDVRNGKFEAAQDKLASFMKDAYGATLNRDYESSISGDTASYWSMYFRNEAEAASICIGQLLP